MLIDNKELRIAVPSKGRLMESALDILARAGLKFRLSGRQLFARCAETGVMVIFSNAQDIPALVAEGVVDLGITGSDLVLEKQATVEEHLRLGFGKCRLSFATHAESGVSSARELGGKILGTKFTWLAGAWFREQGVRDVHIVEINGAVEVMVLLGLVDAILDVVETGSSLAEHDLAERETILKAEAVLIGNGTPRDPALRDRIIRRIEGVLIAFRWSMLEYNCPAARLEEATRITPGFSSPTVQQTDSPDWVAVKVMVEKGAVQEVMDRLEAIGCRAVIETAITHGRL